MEREPGSGSTVLWEPPRKFVEECVLTRYREWLRAERGLSFDDYPGLWRWSTTDLGGFWMSIRDFFGLDISEPTTVVDSSAEMPRVRWFDGATTNYALNALRHDGDDAAIVSFDERGIRTTISRTELRLAVGALADWFREQGVTPGDRIVAYVPNIAAAVVSMLAAAAVGAVWASCAQEYSAEGARDRFAQLEPKILIAADGYRYGGKVHDRRDRVRSLAAALDSVQTVLWIDNLGSLSAEAVTYSEVISKGREPEFTRVSFDHPLWVLFSSGTTGKPKGIVHGHGGIILEHAKFLGLHVDLEPGSRFLWLATPSWMVWNIQVSGLLRGATITTYDGNPTWPEPSQLWRIAERLDLDFLGTSAAALSAAAKLGVGPQTVAPDLHLRGLGSTGSPLPPSTARWVQQVLPDVWLASASGGTDICSAFAGGIPSQPVLVDQIQGPLLGVRLEAWDDAGRPVVDESGEMVVTQPMPSMPIFFWDDPDFARYRRAYFDRFPGVWRHGDWITITGEGGVVVHGRSDATINRNGVRIGSSEIYDVVDRLPEIKECLIVGVELPNGDYWMPLFVVPAVPVADTEAFMTRIRSAIRVGVSPRHVPDAVILLDALPHTRTGKRMEVPVKRILQGGDPATIVNPQAVDDPASLQQFVALRPVPHR